MVRGSMSLNPLSDEQSRAADAWLRGLGKATVERGTALFRKSAVFNVTNSGKNGIRASVQGGQRYSTKLDFIDGEWWGACTCPVVVDCKHCCATMLRALTLLELGEVKPQPASEPEKQPEKKEKKPKAETFADLLATKAGRELSKQEKAGALIVDELFRSREMSLVAKGRLDALSTLGKTGHWMWETVRIWPAPPHSPWQAWLYAANYLRCEKLTPLPAFDEATDWAEVDALVAEWERSDSVEKWRNWLSSAGQVTNDPRVHDLRVCVATDRVLLEWRKNQTGDFKELSYRTFLQIASGAYDGKVPVAAPSLPVWNAFHTGYGSQVEHRFSSRDAIRILNLILRREDSRGLVVGLGGEPLRFATEPLVWHTDVREGTRIDYRLALVLPDGSSPPRPLIVLDGEPSLYVTRDTVFTGPPLGGLTVFEKPILIPAEAMETRGGAALLGRLKIEPPARLKGRFRTVRLRPVFQCVLEKNAWGDAETLRIRVHAGGPNGELGEVYARDGWIPAEPHMDGPQGDGAILVGDRSALGCVPEMLAGLKLNWTEFSDNAWQRKVTGKFPELFSEWLQALPAEAVVELDTVLASLRDPSVVARVTLDVEESGIDWFDIRVALDVEDTTLSKAELKALLDAKGGFVRLGAKGWRKLAFSLSEEDEAQLAELGLSAREFSGEPQRLHALQLAGRSAAKKMIGEEHARTVERRAEEIRTRVQPPLPAGIRAELRPYQLSGFHFLAYLSENRFGGILADDMGLGKTLQTLAWLLWLRSENGVQHPSLVVCPKSVTDNWQNEAARFAPELVVRILPTGANATMLAEARAEAALVVVNYAQLRILAAEIGAVPWGAVILDEAQAIKNPASSTARVAWSLKAGHRLALSGTPIENRLLDLWSIMQFAMPGVLGTRAAFGKTYDQRGDPFARRRLAARVRPFVIRRTKSEVAKDLPARIEEDLFCELEGPQSTLYRAELKRARAALLKLGTKAELDSQRFHILSSLLRLRQICCHPALIGASKKRKAAAVESGDADPAPDSAKLAALLDILEPLVAEGHKVLVFSQFVEMLSLIRAEIAAREWPHFVLTGETEDRGPLVASFQDHEGSAVFLISLRAGGFGLNLTAASYVVLFDPWWNPAVENQAIDRTHRIGQVNQVIAYRLIVKSSIEEKIRALQKQKSAMAGDILGEESFGRALSLEDFQFLFGE